MLQEQYRLNLHPLEERDRPNSVQRFQSGFECIGSTINYHSFFALSSVATSKLDPPIASPY